MTRAIRVLPVLILALWVAPPVRAAAPCSVPGTHATIQAAIDDSSCNPIDVAAGTFDENIELGRSVEIIGAGTGSTIIDGTGGPVVGTSGPTAHTFTLRNLTVTGGGSGGPDGGGFQVEEAAHTLVLTDVAVRGNSGATNGGGLALLDGSTLVMTGGEIADNMATSFAGGFESLGGGDVTLTGVRIAGNTAPSVGAFYTEVGSLAVHGGSIDGNEATTDIAAFYAFNVVDVTMTDSTIRNNTAPSGYSSQIATDTLTVRDLLVDGNSAGSGGLGVYAETSANIESSAFVNNTASEASGGGLSLSASGGTIPLDVSNSTISGNRARGNGGGVAVENGVFTGTNLTITNNTADDDADGAGSGG
ncbi:MAG: hypothetical protein M3135_04260, partial [Actinomycetota bacterium]|nr:hypothetical protein [Actinomycetota bacterium]